MADNSGVVSLSQAPTAENDSLEHTLLSIPTLSASEGGGGGVSSKSNTLIYHQYCQQHLIPPPSWGTPARKLRGRPPGSKNKPRPPLVITRESDSVMKTVILEISAGCDIIDTVTNFAQRNHVGVTIISATGSVSNVTLRNPVPHAPSLFLFGSYGLLSLSGSFDASIPTLSSSITPQPSLSCSFGVTLAGAQGQVFGGMVGGKIMVATEATLVAATFVNPSFHRLPCEVADDQVHRQETRPRGVHANDGGGNSGGEGGGFVGGGTESCSFTGVSMPAYGVAVPAPLNYQTSPDVMTRGPPPPCPY
ncbi:Calcium-dependent lipid-binding family protein [Hibiscus syriacus]|uniref:Calcium-dependent lipid-binding family protein n=1 Tax=Hibiscus syriacus TaxID=106335 RepID=A0A6A3CYL7_HIBSY|nr:AT-hook motif nuclear-localized protein 17-like [Hibiscus syriacus]KAE8732372.1 Calcium-dependent lipid-binding family protein [Hibiscus syriacus]